MDFIADNMLLLQAGIFLVVTGALLAIGGLIGNYDRLIEARIRGLAAPHNRDHRRENSILGTIAEKWPHLAKNFRPPDEQSYGRLKTRLGEAGIQAPAAVPLFIAAKCFFTVV